MKMKMKMKNTLIFVYLLRFLSIACECEALGFDKVSNDASFVFSGILINKDTVEKEKAPILNTFYVKKIWKSDMTDTLEIYSGYGGPDCGYDFDVGKEYLIFVYNKNYTNRCIRTTILDESPDPFNLDAKYNNIPILINDVLTDSAMSFIRKLLKKNSGFVFSKPPIIVMKSKIISWIELFKLDSYFLQNLKLFELPSAFVKNNDLNTNNLLVVYSYDYYNKKDDYIKKKAMKVISKNKSRINK